MQKITDIKVTGCFYSPVGKKKKEKKKEAKSMKRALKIEKYTSRKRGSIYATVLIAVEHFT